MPTSSDDKGPATIIAEFDQGFGGSERTYLELFYYADALRLVGRREDALRVYDLIDPLTMPEWKRWLVDHYRGTLYFDSGRYPEAERMFRSSVSQNPESTSPWIWLASSLAEQEKFEDAVDVLSGAVELEGDRDEVYLNMAYSLRALGKLQEAKDCLTKALVITADYPAALEELTDVNAALDAIQGM